MRGQREGNGEQSCGPTNRNWIRGGVERGKRARSHEALVTMARQHRSGGCAAKGTRRSTVWRPLRRQGLVANLSHTPYRCGLAERTQLCGLPEQGLVQIGTIATHRSNNPRGLQPCGPRVGLAPRLEMHDNLLMRGLGNPFGAPSSIKNVWRAEV
jgi:hypothetical protein